jgi:riboflavin biosynthesis pyrimidine reductase
MRNVLGYGPIPEAVTLTNNSIVNADINASAAIVASKLNLATIAQDVAIADPDNPTRTLQIIHDSGSAQLISTYGALQFTSEGSNYLQFNSDIKQSNRANNGATITLPFIVSKEIAISSVSAQGGGTLIWSAADQFLLQRVIVRAKALSLGTNAVLHIAVGKTQKSAADAALSGDEIVYLKDNTVSSAPVTFGAAASEEGAVLNSDDFEFVVANANFYFNWRNRCLFSW